MVESDRTGERLKSLTRQIQRLLGEIDPVILRYPGSFECINGRPSVAAGDIQESKRLDGLVDQNSAQLAIDLAMVEKVGVDELSIELPLVLEQCGRWLGIVSWCAVCFQTMLLSSRMIQRPIRHAS